MADVTTRMELPFPESTDSNDTPTYMAGLAQDLDDKIAQVGTKASRDGLTGKQGMVHLTTDGGGSGVLTLSRHDGSVWHNLSRYSQGLRDDRPAANTVLPGHMFWATDQYCMHLSDATNWHRVGAKAGTVYGFLGASAPEGSVFGYGQVVSRTGIYTDVFAVYGTLYGEGDGVTTFKMPDLRGKVLVYLDNMGGSDAGILDVTNTLGGTGGEQKHSLTSSENGTHTHVQNAHAHTQNAHKHALSTAWLGYSASSGNDAGTPSAGWISHAADDMSTVAPTINNTTAVNQNSGSGTAHNNMQPYILANGIILL